MALQVSNVEIATLEFGEFHKIFHGKMARVLGGGSSQDLGKKKRLQMSLEDAVVFFSVFQKRTMSLTLVCLDQNRIFVVAGTLLCEGFYLLVSNWSYFLVAEFCWGDFIFYTMDCTPT